MGNTPIIVVQIFICLSLLFSEKLIVKQVAHGYQKPVYLTAPKNQSDTLFIVEQVGRIQTIIHGRRSDPLLDIRNRVHQPKMPGDERGLLGMALHPDFQDNGKFYVNYVNREDVTIISTFKREKEQLTAYKEEIIISIKQPYSNHNGGQLAFGPDGYLYIGLGDGGYAGDPKSNGQNTQTLLGTILRLDINGEKPYIIPLGNPFYNHIEAQPEIYCYGLRNPWRFSFDRETGDLYIGDVGQSSWEEINYISSNHASGANFGWNQMEGSHCYPPGEDCEQDNLTPPIFEYPNNANYIKTLIGWDQNDAKGCSVTGGYVYRGSYIPELYGKYIFGDYCTGKIWSFQVSQGKALDYTHWTIKGIDKDFYLSSFGEDGNGELYLLNHTGAIYNIISVE